MAKPTRYTQEMLESYMANGYWDLTTTSDLWNQCGTVYPDEEALVDSNNRLTWAQVKLHSDRFALWLLELGYSKDEALVMQLPNCVESFIVRLGCEKAGVLCITPMITLRHSEIESILSFVGALGVVIPWQFRNFDFFDMITWVRPGLPTLKHLFVIGAKVPPGARSIKEMLQRPIEEEYPIDQLEKTRFNAQEFAIVGNTSGTSGIPKCAERPIQAQIH
ncbi:AMP-binding protein [Chloroflexota bacterium]